jgi:hypothetical protein
VLLQPEGGVGHGSGGSHLPGGKTQGLEEGLAQVSTEWDALKDEAEREAIAAQSLRVELAEMKTKL